MPPPSIKWRVGACEKIILNNYQYPDYKCMLKKLNKCLADNSSLVKTKAFATVIHFVLNLL